MAIFKPELDSDVYTAPLGIIILECDICHVRFSENVLYNWPLCEAGVPHQRMESNEQIEIIKKLGFIQSIIPCTEKVDYEFRKAGNSYEVFEGSNLPDIHADVQEVRVIRRDFIRFRNNFTFLVWFASKVTGINKPTHADLLKYVKEEKKKGGLNDKRINTGTDR